MSKASYDTKNIGHYGLCFSDYTHFTSPIRRYADLLVHRLLEEKITNVKANSTVELSELSKHISHTERKAAEAERDSVKFFQTIFLIDHIGENFNGTDRISSLVKQIPVTPFKRQALFSKGISNQPHRLGLPVVTPNSAPSFRNKAPLSPVSSVGKGPDPTRVI